jgi:hypothetical protein
MHPSPAPPAPLGRAVAALGLTAATRSSPRRCVGGAEGSLGADVKHEVCWVTDSGYLSPH